jgi:hypothetical protein
MAAQGQCMAFKGISRSWRSSQGQLKVSVGLSRTFQCHGRLSRAVLGHGGNTKGRSRPMQGFQGHGILLW